MNLNIFCTSLNQYRTTTTSSRKLSEEPRDEIFLEDATHANYFPGLAPTARQMYSTYKHLYESDPFSSKIIAAVE